MKNCLIPILFFLHFVAVISCQKDPGPGGPGEDKLPCRVETTILNDDLNAAYHYDHLSRINSVEWTNAKGDRLTGYFKYQDDKIAVVFYEDSIFRYRWDLDLDERGFVKRLQVKNGRFAEFSYNPDGLLASVSIFDENAEFYSIKYNSENGQLLSARKTWNDGHVDTLYFEWTNTPNLEGYYSIQSVINFMEYPTWSGFPFGAHPPFLIRAETHRLQNGGVFRWENDYQLNEQGYVTKWTYRYFLNQTAYPERKLEWFYDCEPENSSLTVERFSANPS